MTKGDTPQAGNYGARIEILEAEVLRLSLEAASDLELIRLVQSNVDEVVKLLGRMIESPNEAWRTGIPDRLDS